MSEADTQSPNLKEHLDYVNRRYKGTFSCIHCFDDPNHGEFLSRESLWEHCLENHSRWFPVRSDKLLRYREAYEDVCYRAAKVKSTKPIHDVHDNLASGAPVYAPSISSGPALSSRRQSLSRTPESKESLPSSYDHDDGDVHLEIPSGRPASPYADRSVSNHENKLPDFAGVPSPTSNYEDELCGATGYQADIAGEPVKLTDNLPWRQRLPRVEVNNIPSHSYVCDISSLPINYKDDTRHDTSLKNHSRNYGSYQTVAFSYCPRPRYYSGPDKFPIIHDNTIREDSSSQDDILDEPVKLADNALSKLQHAIDSSSRTFSESHIRLESNKPIEATTLISQPETKPISQELLVIEEEKIYTSLSMKDKNCPALEKPALEYGVPTSWRRPRSSSRHKGGVRIRHRSNPDVFSLNAKPRENRRMVLRIQINDQDHLACPDSGSEKNIISKTFAVEHGFHIRRKAKDIKQFEVGNGGVVWSIGRVLETVGLPGSPLWKKKRRFYVLENCPVPLVMGIKFLKEAEILTKYRHLLETCPAEVSNISALLWIGSPESRLRCTIDGRKLEAKADTGSDLNLMSLECAAKGEFRIDTRMEARTQIVLGSGQVIETLGQVYVSNLTLDWREPETDTPERSPNTAATGVPLDPDPHGSADSQHEGDDDLYTTFHVVKHLPWEIVLGQKFLHDTDAFNKCPELLDSPRTKQSRKFGKDKQQFEFMIFRSRILPHISFSKKAKLAVDLREQHDSDWHGELYRRSKNTEEKIASLPPGEREAARKTEGKKVRDWNTAHASCKFCNPGSAT